MAGFRSSTRPSRERPKDGGRSGTTGVGTGGGDIAEWWRDVGDEGRHRRERSEPGHVRKSFLFRRERRSAYLVASLLVRELLRGSLVCPIARGRAYSWSALTLLCVASPPFVLSSPAGGSRALCAVCASRLCFFSIPQPPRSLHGPLVLVVSVDLMRAAVLPRARWTSTSTAAERFVVDPSTAITFQRAGALFARYASMLRSRALVDVLDARKRDKRWLRCVCGLGCIGLYSFIPACWFLLLALAF